jgi:hypothetical protein
LPQRNLLGDAFDNTDIRLESILDDTIAIADLDSATRYNPYLKQPQSVI